MDATGYILIEPGSPFYSRDEQARLVVRGYAGLRAVAIQSLTFVPRIDEPDSDEEEPSRFVKVNFDTVRDPKGNIRGYIIPAGLAGGLYTIAVDEGGDNGAGGEGELAILSSTDFQEFWADNGREVLADPIVCRNGSEIYSLTRECVEATLVERLGMADVEVEWYFHDRLGGAQEIYVPRGMFLWGASVAALRAYDRVCMGGQLLCAVLSEPKRLLFRAVGRSSFPLKDREWIGALRHFSAALPDRWTVNAAQEGDRCVVELEFAHGMGSASDSLLEFGSFGVPFGGSNDDPGEGPDADPDDPEEGEEGNEDEEDGEIQLPFRIKRKKQEEPTPQIPEPA